MVTRSPPPPPLQLLHDNTLLEHQRPPLPKDRPPHRPPRTQWETVKLFWKIYKTDWRTVVIAVAMINTLRFSFAATDAFEHLNLDTLHYVPRLARVSAALGGIYIASAVIQAFGVLSVSMKRLVLIRIYAHLSFLSALLITTAGFLSGVSYFLLGEDLVMECTSISVLGNHVTRDLLRAKSVKSALPSLKAAYEKCSKSHSHPQTAAHLLPISLLLFSVIPSILFFLLSYTYYRQSIDPTHPANLIHKPLFVLTTERGRGRARTKPSDTDTGKSKARAAPQERLSLLGDTIATTTATSPSKSIDISTLLARQQRNRNSHTNSRSQSPYNITPGPPSFGPAPGPSRRVLGVGAAAGVNLERGADATRGRGHVPTRSVWFSRTGTASGGSEDAGYGYQYGYGDSHVRLI